MEELVELKEGLESLEEWIYQEVEKRPVIYDYKYLHRVFETKKEYRDFLGWVNENLRMNQKSERLLRSYEAKATV
jgi:hypothetical protein